MNLKRRQAFYGDWWDEAAKWRTGGFDRLCGGVPGSPSTEELQAAGVQGTLFVHEVLTVRAGSQLDFLAAVVEERVPLMREYGHEPTGLYEVLANQHEVVMVWATDIPSQVRLRETATRRGAQRRGRGRRADRRVGTHRVRLGHRRRHAHHDPAPAYGVRASRLGGRITRRLVGDVVELETLLYREENRVAYVTLNRPEVQNSFDYTMIDELAQVWQALRGNDDVRAVVLTGAGDRAFCTGNDRSTIPFDVKWDPYTYDDPGVSIGPRVNRMWKPVIAAVNGTAAAGAFYLLGQVDFIIAADHATFVDPHVTYAMPAVYEPIEALAKMPFGEAMRVALLGANERMSARRGLRDRLRERGRPVGGADGRGHVGGRGDRGTTTGGDHGDAAHALGRARDVPVAGHRAREHVPAPRHGHRQGEPEGGRGDVRQPPAHQTVGQVAASASPSVVISSCTSSIVSMGPDGTIVSSGMVRSGCASIMATNSAMVRPRSADCMWFL